MSGPVNVPIPEGWVTYFDNEKGFLVAFDPQKQSSLYALANTLYPDYEDTPKIPLLIDQVKEVPK